MVDPIYRETSRKAGFKGGSHSYGPSPGNSSSGVRNVDCNAAGPCDLGKHGGGGGGPMQLLPVTKDYAIFVPFYSD